ncbi:MAG: transcription termination factor Rho [Acidobacteriota bacterium]|jgi:transcription termination factor Rho|nr:transcription termination factor Rho [Acidobacteriota bacterium]
MTPDNRTPRKRRRRRRRPQDGAPAGNGGAPNGNTASPGNEARAHDGGGLNRPRRRRSRNRKGGAGGSGRPMPGDNAGTQTPIDIPPGEQVTVSGVLFLKNNGSGLLVQPGNNYVPQPTDAIVPRSMIERLHLQPGLLLAGGARRGGNGGLELVGLETVEGMTLEEYRDSRHPFSELISIDPNEMFKLETESERLTTRVIDLLSPLGKGQRCLIVAPPKAGKTTLLKDIAHGINTNHSDVTLMVLLVDERPEEVTDFRRSVAKGEVIASSSDETAENHIQIAEVVLERARRLVEMKKDVVILCDSITRMSRAYNNEQRGSGKILSGGIDARTMEKPRRFFGAARNAEDWGSLTIIATALVDTGSRMDEVIFQEFKGTGNTEIVLDRALFERRIFPAINIAQTGTRKEEKLLPPTVLPKTHTLRRALAGTDPMNAMKMLLERLQKFPTNEAFLKSF